MALQVIGRLSDSERPDYFLHLAHCERCAEEERELSGLSDALCAADLEGIDEEEMPASLEAAVLGQLRSEEATRRSREAWMRRRRRIAGATLSAAAACVLVLALFLFVGSSGGTKTVQLSGEPGVRASVQLTQESWGTAVRVEESGQPGGRVMWVSMRTVSGRWWSAGTYRSVSSGTARVDLACALKLQDIKWVYVEDSTGRVLLHAYLS